jgi:hypothetical protein
LQEEFIAFIAKQQAPGNGFNAVAQVAANPEGGSLRRNLK